MAKKDQVFTITIVLVNPSNEAPLNVSEVQEWIAGKTASAGLGRKVIGLSVEETERKKR